MRIQSIEATEALARLKAAEAGLSAVEAAERLREFGPNRIEQLRERSLLRQFAGHFTQFFAMILWIAAGLAFFAESQHPGQGMAAMGWAIVAVIVINGSFSFWQEHVAERTIGALERLLPHEVKAVRDGKTTLIPTENVVPGDVILLDEGDDVPADCRLIEASNVRVNQATLTGESLPVARTAEPSEEEDLLGARNVALTGASLVAGRAKCVVFATGMRTEFGKIARLSQAKRPDLSPLQKEIARLSKLVAGLAMGLGGFFFFLGRYAGLTPWENFMFAIGIIIANVPEGLLPTVTVALAFASRRMAERNAVVRHLPSIETLGSTTVICTDKTGTLTENKMRAIRLFADGEFVEPVALEGDAAGLARHRALIDIALNNHDLKVVDSNGQTKVIGDPMERAIVEMARAIDPRAAAMERADEIPFDTERKRMATLHQREGGLWICVKGALETVLPLCQRARIGGEAVRMTAEIRQAFLDAQERMAEDGLRILAFAERAVPEGADRAHWEEDLAIAGLVGLADPPRPETAAAIAACRKAGIRVIMITGDHPHTAIAIGRQIGLVEGPRPSVILGGQLRHMTEAELRLALGAPEVIFARVGADQKMRVVEALKSKGEVVAVTGDGVNDAPALRRADIGIAMGVAGTDVAREAADMVLLDDNFASIVQAIEEGRSIFDNIRKFLTYILASNVPELIPYLAFALLKFPLALTIIQILAVDLGTDLLPALGLGAEGAHHGVMSRPPRRKERLMTWGMIARAYLLLGLIEAVAAMACFYVALRVGGWSGARGEIADHAGYRQATTWTLVAIILMQVFNVFICRSRRDSVFKTGVRGNNLILAGVAAELALALLIVYTPFGNLLFGTAPIPLAAWLLPIPFGLLMVGADELRKRLAPPANGSANGT